MRWIFILPLLVLSLSLCRATKETLNGWERLMDNPNFLRRIAKRLRLEEPVGIEDSISDTDGDSQDANTDFYDRGYADNPPIEEEPQKTVPEKKDKTVEDSFSNKCEYNTNLNSIIRSTDSLKAGAFFLKFFNNITAQECVSGCCDTQGCNLAVYENKGNRSCYLFNCPDDKSCTFAHHNDYMGMSFPHISSVPTHETDQDRHEGELEGLGKNNGILPPEKVPSKVSDLTTTVPTTPKTTPPESLPPQAVVCGESQFKCVARDTEKLKCYDLSARCDGVAQCADSSDEQDCAFKSPAVKTPPPLTHDVPGVDEHNVNHPKHVLPATQMPPTPAMRTTTVAFRPEIEKPSEVMGESSEEDETDDSDKKTEEPSLDGDENNDAAHTDKSSENMSEDSDNSGNVPDKKSGSEPEQKSGSVPDQKSESVTSQGDINSENVSLNRTVTHGDTVVVVEETDNLLEEQDVVVVASPTDNAQGPIVALALGLAITLILLIFVGCRLRNVKRRLRKGRALHSNEADYLINGMYL